MSWRMRSRLFHHLLTVIVLCLSAHSIWCFTSLHGPFSGPQSLDMDGGCGFNVKCAWKKGALQVFRGNRSSRTSLLASRTGDGTAAAPVTEEIVSEHFRVLWEELDRWYSDASRIRCPFFRRRASDVIDNMALLARFLLIRHKSILPPDVYNPPGCRAIGKRGEDGLVLPKLSNLPANEIAELIKLDWEGSNEADHKGYYITGNLNTLIYRDDCVFDGPDPDMPVRGLRKYISAASHLFDHRKSYAELLDVHVIPTTDGTNVGGTVEVSWKIGGVLMLPWRPIVKPWTGKTRYHLDKEGLIHIHEEEWDISVLEAFVCTVFPDVGEVIWG